MGISWDRGMDNSSLPSIVILNTPQPRNEGFILDFGVFGTIDWGGEMGFKKIEMCHRQKMDDVAIFRYI